MDLTIGNPFQCLLKFAIPVILGNLFQLFYTLADSVIVGKTLGADALAADRISHGISDVCHVYRPAGYADSGKFTGHVSRSRIYSGIQSGSAFRSGK